MINVFRTNPYGDEIKIDNLLVGYKDLPQDQQDMISSNLYSIVMKNLPEGSEIPKDGAMIREGSSQYDYNEDTRVYYGKFIVDIPSIEQSYMVQFTWSPVKNNNNLGGYDVVTSCLPRSMQIYDDFSLVCKNLIESNANWQNAYQLDYTVGARTSVIIRDLIGRFLMSELVGEDGYDINIDAVSLKREKNEPDLTYSFTISLNETYDFNVLVRVDEQFGAEYIAILINGDSLKKGFVLTDSDVLKNTLTEWLKSKISGIEVEQKSLKDYEE